MKLSKKELEYISNVKIFLDIFKINLFFLLIILLILVLIYYFLVAYAHIRNLQLQILLNYFLI